MTTFPSSSSQRTSRNGYTPGTARAAVSDPSLPSMLRKAVRSSERCKARRPSRRSSRSRIETQQAERNRRVEAYRQLVRPVAIHYARCSNESSEDLLQVGMMGLLRAAELFTDDRQTPFEVFARPHIRGAMLHYLRDVAPRVRLPRRQAELMERCWKASGATGEAPLEARAQARSREDLGVGLEQWYLFLRQRSLNRALPFEEQGQREREGALPLSTAWEGLAVDGSGETEHPPETMAQEGKVEQLLQPLDRRERQVVERVVLQGESYRRVAAELQISPMTVKRALKRGLDQLRQRLLEQGFRTGMATDPARSGAPGC